MLWQDLWRLETIESLIGKWRFGPRRYHFPPRKSTTRYYTPFSFEKRLFLSPFEKYKPFSNYCKRHKKLLGSDKYILHFHLTPLVLLHFVNVFLQCIDFPPGDIPVQLYQPKYPINNIFTAHTFKMFHWNVATLDFVLMHWKIFITTFHISFDTLR